jgi:hypothetical protein
MTTGLLLRGTDTFGTAVYKKRTVFYDEVRRKEHEWGSGAGQERENKIPELDE